MSLIIVSKNFAQSKDTLKAKPTIVFVHGLWADGSCWQKVMNPLIEKGYKVICVQNPTTSLADDVAATKRAIERTKGDVILVGHSWGGFVITEAGAHPRVKALVYVAAYAPDNGETVTTVSAKAPATELSKFLENLEGYVTLSKDGVTKAFAQDLAPKEQNEVYAVQPPAFYTLFADVCTDIAWKNKPSWYVVAAKDKCINPELEKLMAKRANAKTTVVESSHVAMLSHPKEVLEVVLSAIKSVSN